MIPLPPFSNLGLPEKWSNSYKNTHEQECTFEADTIHLGSEKFQSRKIGMYLEFTFLLLKTY